MKIGIGHRTQKWILLLTILTWLVSLSHIRVKAENILIDDKMTLKDSVEVKNNTLIVNTLIIIPGVRYHRDFGGIGIHSSFNYMPVLDAPMHLTVGPSIKLGKSIRLFTGLGPDFWYFDYTTLLDLDDLTYEVGVLIDIDNVILELGLRRFDRDQVIPSFGVGWSF